VLRVPALTARMLADESLRRRCGAQAAAEAREPEEVKP